LPRDALLYQPPKLYCQRPGSKVMAKCYSCGKESRGGMPTAKIEGEQRSYCADCYWKVEKEYKAKQSCEDCSYFTEEQCKKTGKNLEPAIVGYGTYYVKAEGCKNFSTDKEIALAEVKKLESTGQLVEAAAAYQRLGMEKEANALQAKAEAKGEGLATQVRELAKNGQVVSYYCCHCGAPLKVGAKNEAKRRCPSCKGDLEVIDLGKLIQQHSNS
jgi:hypothetical protein